MYVRFSIFFCIKPFILSNLLSCAFHRWGFSVMCDGRCSWYYDAYIQTSSERDFLRPSYFYGLTPFENGYLQVWSRREHFQYLCLITLKIQIRYYILKNNNICFKSVEAMVVLQYLSHSMFPFVIYHYSESVMYIISILFAHLHYIQWVPIPNVYHVP